MRRYSRKQEGLSLIVSLILLVALTILVLSGIRGTTLNERMSGSAMERARAYQAAEQAMQQGMSVLITDGTQCVTSTGCTAGDSGYGGTAAVLPTAWNSSGAASITTAAGQLTSASFVINKLPEATYVPSTKSGCMAYSVMGRGQGLNSISPSTVVLQTIAFVCPTS